MVVLATLDSAVWLAVLGSAMPRAARYGIISPAARWSNIVEGTGCSNNILPDFNIYCPVDIDTEY